MNVTQVLCVLLRKLFIHIIDVLPPHLRAAVHAPSIPEVIRPTRQGAHDIEEFPFQQNAL